MKTSKKVKISVAALLVAFSFVACKKNKCAECHYDANGSEVELGNYCGDDLENIEANGYSDGNATYTVHCGEDH